MTNDDGYVSYKPTDEMVQVEIKDGKVDLSIYLSNEVAGDSDGDLESAISAWAEGTSSVIIEPHFTIASPVDYLVEFHALAPKNGHIELAAKPIFEAVKAEMLVQIARIDALSFKDAS